MLYKYYGWILGCLICPVGVIDSSITMFDGKRTSCLGFKHSGVIYCLALVLLDEIGLLVVSPHVLPIQ